MEETKMMVEENAPKCENKFSYEELEKTAKELYVQCTNMAAEIQRLRMDNSFKRLDYLFKTLEYYSLLDNDFVRNCAKEIQEIMTIPEEETNNAE